jgi:hypothetical protein
MDTKSESNTKKIGKVTSVAVTKEGTFALGYLKCKRQGHQVDLQGLQVYVNGDPVKVCYFWFLLELLTFAVDSNSILDAAY